MTPSAETRQENRVKTFLSQEANMKLGLEKMHRAMKAENSAGVKAEKIRGQLFCYSLSELKYPSGWPAMSFWGHDKEIGM